MALVAIMETAASDIISSNAYPCHFPLQDEDSKTLPALPPPVVAELSKLDNEDGSRVCRSCKSNALHVDWAQGDRVCTECGVVDEGHLLDDRPEWREFNDADDLAKGGPALARSGLVLVDDTKYLGGLQPTTLSRQVFGGSTGTSGQTRKRLMAANRRMDRKMEKMHARAVETAQLSCRLKRKLKTEELDDSELDVRPEMEQMVLQEEEDAERLKSALHADKWSLKRAIKLFGSSDEISSSENQYSGEDMDDLREQLDAKSLQASRELYRAYSMLLASARKLAVPDRVTNEALSLLCKYAVRRDGIVVRGVSSTLKAKKNAAISVEKEKEARAALRDYNGLKQSGALCAALLFYTSRKLGWPRSLVEVCESIVPLSPSQTNQALEIGKEQFIKKRHCSRAMSEIKELFPDLARASPPISTEHPGLNTKYADESNIANFTEHTVRKLQLPLVAEACVRTLAVHWHRANTEKSTSSSTTLNKPAVVCAALALFVCHAGDAMQRLAAQADRLNKRKAASKGLYPIEKRLKFAPDDEGDTIESQKEIESKAFDVFDESTYTDDWTAEKRAYEMGRVWDAWTEQMPWARSLSVIEQSCGVSSSSVLEYYRRQIYPERQWLLQTLSDAVVSDQRSDDVPNAVPSLRGTPLSTVLLPQIVLASKMLQDA